jgi:uncharacterized protein YkwD
MRSETRTTIIIIFVIVLALAVEVVLFGASNDLQGTAVSGQDARVIELMNTARTAAGMSGVTVDPLLTQAAAAHCADMLTTDVLTHTGTDGSQPWDRLDRVGYNWGNVGENVLYRWDASPEGAFDQWWNSPGHKANMMNADFTQTGVAACKHGSGKFYYVMVLAAPL